MISVQSPTSQVWVSCHKFLEHQTIKENATNVHTMKVKQEEAPINIYPKKRLMQYSTHDANLQHFPHSPMEEILVSLAAS